MSSDIKKIATDGTIDADYTWGRRPTAYLSTLQYVRVILFRARLEADRTAEELGRADFGPFTPWWW